MFLLAYFLFLVGIGSAVLALSGVFDWFPVGVFNSFAIIMVILSLAAIIWGRVSRR